jgi:hypothetical protein
LPHLTDSAGANAGFCPFAITRMDYRSKAMQFDLPDNEADKTIVLRISGNRLVSILNTFDMLMYETGRYKVQGNDIVPANSRIADLRQLTEAIRDELSAQRNNTTADDIRASMPKARQ